jgi:hypothetical protein
MDVTISTPGKTIAAMTKTPEEWLNEIAPEKPRGIFKLFLGYAPGVGKLQHAERGDPPC